MKIKQQWDNTVLSVFFNQGTETEILVVRPLLLLAKLRNSLLLLKPACPKPELRMHVSLELYMTYL